MRHLVFVSLCLGGAVFLAGCQRNGDAQVQRALKDVNVIDESNQRRGKPTANATWDNATAVLVGDY